MKLLNSIQGRLLALLMGLMVYVWVAATILTWYDAQHELDELLDSHLAQAASLLLIQSESNEHEHMIDAPTLHRYAPRVAFQVFKNGRLTIHSENASHLAMSTAESGFNTVELRTGEPWRVYGVVQSEKRLQVFVGEQLSARRDILLTILRSVLWPLLFALPVLIFAGWWSVRQGLAPIYQLRRLITRRKPQSTEPIELIDPPRELRPLVAELNELLARVAKMLELERRFTADAAHELRTPIAAIKMQAQVALSQPDRGAEKNLSIQKLLINCDRAGRLIEQLMMLSRLDAEVDRTDESSSDLLEVTEQISAEMATTAIEKHQNLSLIHDDTPLPPVPVRSTLLGILIRNLLDNAIKYSGETSTISIVVRGNPDWAELVIEDSGPGMPSSDLLRLGDRFFRARQQGIPGSGLGWSIVKRIAESSKAEVHVENSEQLHGLKVSVKWSVHRR